MPWQARYVNSLQSGTAGPLVELHFILHHLFRFLTALIFMITCLFTVIEVYEYPNDCVASELSYHFSKEPFLAQCQTEIHRMYNHKSSSFILQFSLQGKKVYPLGLEASSKPD